MFLEIYFRSLPDDRKILLGRYRIVDVARKVVGVGSVGTRCWVILMRGKAIGASLQRCASASEFPYISLQ